MADLHYCGDRAPKDRWKEPAAGPCFPTLQPLLASVECEMHICVFERNDEPARELELSLSKLPPNALDLRKCSTWM